MGVSIGLVNIYIPTKMAKIPQENLPTNGESNKVALVKMNILPTDGENGKGPIVKQTALLTYNESGRVMIFEIITMPALPKSKASRFLMYLVMCNKCHILVCSIVSSPFYIRILQRILQ